MGFWLTLLHLFSKTPGEFHQEDKCVPSLLPGLKMATDNKFKDMCTSLSAILTMEMFSCNEQTRFGNNSSRMLNSTLMSDGKHLTCWFLLMNAT